MSKRKKKIIVIIAILLMLCLLSAWGFLMKSSTYKIHSKKLPKGLKIVFLSDLHNCFYGGTDQSQLKDWIEEEDPDILIFGGDVIDQWGGQKYAKRIMEWAAERYPTYYTPGNHEQYRNDRTDFYDWVKSSGINFICDDFVDIEIKGQKIRIYGIIDKNSGGYLDDLKGKLDDKYYNILLAHQPEQIDDYLDTGDVKFDLILSGHAHGGQWRIPKLLDQGLYAPDQGIFPKYTCGEYHYGDTVHIISKGLAKPARMIFIPRIFNRPEFSVIEIGE
ncbi:MAG: phosphoesterase [Ruminococcus sp.]|nr:phosphoesterase [Ruminococcus sp.]